MLRALLEHAVDYAGLFPPARLEMRRAVENYAAYLSGPDRWALGRFVVPAARLDEFARAAGDLLPCAPAAEAWQLTAIGAADLAADAARIARFNSAHAQAGEGAVVDAVELRAETPGAVRDAAKLAPPGTVVYVELPLGDALPSLVAAVRDSGMRAKVRTGGVTADAFPDAAALADFIVRCTRAGVAFKATAGLHHPLRSIYPLTYEQGSPAAPMFGYLNVLLAAALAHAGVGAPELTAVLEAGSLDDFRFSADGITWRDVRLSVADVRRVRERGAIAFGSCSFTEPMGELAALHL